MKRKGMCDKCSCIIETYLSKEADEKRYYFTNEINCPQCGECKIRMIKQ